MKNKTEPKESAKYIYNRGMKQINRATTKYFDGVKNGRQQIQW